MKSEHRHELKTNELAEWLSNLPQWTKEHLITIICVSALVVVLVGVYLWRGYNRDVVQVREKTEFTSLVNQVMRARALTVQEQEQGRDMSFELLKPAEALGTFALNTENNRMAALALVTRAQALRAELHYGTVEQQYIVDQTKKAKDSYTTALAKSSNNPVLAAAAEFGLGLCEEDLGNFEQARQVYRQIVANPDYESIVTVVQAQRRLKTMADYEQKIAFKPDPNPEPVAPSTPAQVRLPANIVRPFNFNLPLDLSMFTEANEPGGNK
jgi:tetratricopeptide (TPR) repeat protein